MNLPPKKVQPEDFPTTDSSPVGGIRGYVGFTGPTGLVGPTGITGPIGPPVERKEPFRLGFFSRLAHQFLGYGPAGAAPDAAPSIAEAVRMGITGPVGHEAPGPIGEELPGPAGNPILVREVPAGQVGLDANIIATFPVAPGLNADERDCLELLEEAHQKVDEEDDSGCTICQETCKGETLVMTLPCLHRFHQSCITRWFGAHTTCPICRTDFSRPTE